MMEIWARAFPAVHFAAMHPGIVGTDLMKSTMLQFYESGKDVFRTKEQGADTIVWLGISEEAAEQANGQFYLGMYASNLVMTLKITLLREGCLEMNTNTKTQPT